MSGRFKEAGPNAQVSLYTDMKLAAKDLLEGKLQAAQLTLPPYLALKTGKGPVDSPKPMVATQFTGTEGGAIVLKKGSPAKRLEDLDGLTIASHAKLTVHYLILATLMERKKFSRESIQNIAVRPLPHLVPSLKNGDIDGFIAPEPVNSLARAKGAGEAFVGTKMLWTEHPCCLAATTESFAGYYREMLQAFTNVMVRTGLEMVDRQARKGR
jgi:nitrate/nitrite transport system substrate-binding protein